MSGPDLLALAQIDNGYLVAIDERTVMAVKIDQSAMVRGEVHHEMNGRKVLIFDLKVGKTRSAHKKCVRLGK